MPAGLGLKSRTRDLFSRSSGRRARLLSPSNCGDYVDVKVTGSIHKGMPHKFYHGHTSRVWNFTNHATDVEVNKQFQRLNSNLKGPLPPLPWSIVREYHLMCYEINKKNIESPWRKVQNEDAGIKLDRLSEEIQEMNLFALYLNVTVLEILENGV
ncbi:uncharacterized protein LOC111368269 [Olea europaea var. sylvestris]|uniref:uncharacterized protein LOC111368269 n=1 Tax=Olea europaea var. sylvestris TaxID=158386 RepID=UPI000C1D298A|nr:uncharacterized protein LOC111368269 [Olea europaea var. sylvestris]